MNLKLRLTQLALFGFLLAAPMAAQAQEQSAAQAACHPVTDPNEDPIINEHTMAGTHGGVMLWQSVKNKGCAFYDKLNNLLNKEAEAVVPKYDSLPETQKKNWLQKLLSPSEVIEAEEPETKSKPLEEDRAAVQAEMWAHDLNNPEYRRKLVNNGEKVFPNGATYEGELKDGQPDGVGVMVYPDGEAQRGQFGKDGDPVGLAEDVKPSGESEAGRYGDGQLVAGTSQAADGKARAAVWSPDDSTPMGLVEIDTPDGKSHDDYIKDGKVLAQGPDAEPGADPVPPPEPAGLPPEPTRDVPLWSPQAPVGTILAEEMRWDPDQKLDWASWSPEDGSDPLGNARFCRPLTDTLTALQQQQCNEDRSEVTAKLKSKDPIGERMFCQPLTGYMPPDLMEACGIQPEPPPVQTARPAPAPAPAPQQRVAVAAPPPAQSISVVQMCAKEIAAYRATGSDPGTDAQIEGFHSDVEEAQGGLAYGRSLLHPAYSPDDHYWAAANYQVCISRARLIKLGIPNP